MAKQKYITYLGGTARSSSTNYTTLTIGKQYYVDNESTKEYGVKNDRREYYAYPRLNRLFSTSSKKNVQVDSVTLISKKLENARALVTQLEDELKIATITPFPIYQKYVDEDEYLDTDGIDQLSEELNELLGLTGSSFEVRQGGNHSMKGLYLSTAYDWSIVEDNEGMIVLIPKNK